VIKGRKLAVEEQRKAANQVFCRPMLRR